jgi:hypothetical protein
MLIMSGAALRIFDPPMCCSTGVCGPTVDPELVRFAQDVAWLKHHGVDIERYNLAQEPAAFVKNPAVLELLNAEDTACLPVVMAGDEVVSTRVYPSREELAAFANPAEGV